MQEAYADIHHYEGIDPNMVDDDGDPLQGWYFQLMRAIGDPISALIGPYGSHSDCEDAAIFEWNESD